MHVFDLARIGSGLVVSQFQSEIEAALAAGSVVITAPPGTGKTTVVPPVVANALPAGRIIVTQPRRVAVRAAARRIAQLDGSRLGGPSGFTVRGERVVSDETRIETVTPGVLLRRLLNDPGLEGVAAVIIDEVHERSLDSDLLLGLLGEVRALRDDLVLIAMSATVDADAFSQLLDAPIVAIPSVLHPLDIAYAPAASPRLGPRGVERGFLDHIASLAVSEQAASRHDALVFVPSARDVDEVVKRIRALSSSVEALPLHGRLSPAEQDRATSGRVEGDLPRIVVSTALAESSLTVPGVRLVIDGGLSREVRRDQARDMSGLVTVSASRASADQRAGRAARQGPGRAVRAYTEAEFAAFRAASDPEILSADLVDAALTLAEWGTQGGAGLPLLTAPPAASMARAIDVLESLELIDTDGRPTPLGARVSRLPVGAREGRALLAADGDPHGSAEVNAAMSGDYRDNGADFDALLRALRRGDTPGTSRWRSDVKRLARIAEDRRGHQRDQTPAEQVAGHAASAGSIAALARPDWIARRVADGSRSYLLASGTRAALPEGSSLAGSEWIAVCEVQRAEGRAADGTGAVIRLAAALAEDDALAIGHVRTSRVATLEDGRVRVREERRLGSIVLSSTRAKARDEDTVSALVNHIREHGIPWSENAAALRARLQLIHRELGAPWPDVSDSWLLEHLDEWLAPHVRGSSLAGIDYLTALRGLLPWPEASRLDELAPERLAVPSGSSARIDYPAEADGRPVVAVKLQEVFGLAETPRLVDGRVPVQFHLLSPARRPLAVTEDLSSFWNGPYQDVRKEMRGRYPKHPWPEDPWTAPATAKTNRRLREG